MKMCPPIVLGEISGVLVNTLTVDGKYPVQDYESLQFPIQTQLSEKEKTCSQFCIPFHESRSNFKRFQKENDCHS